MVMHVRSLGDTVFGFFFFKQKTAYEMRISDWSSDVCSSDLRSTNYGLICSMSPISHSPSTSPKRTIAIFAKRIVNETAHTADDIAHSLKQIAELLQGAGHRVIFGAQTAAHFELKHYEFMVLSDKIGRAHVRTPVTNEHIVCRHLL